MSERLVTFKGDPSDSGVNEFVVEVGDGGSENRHTLVVNQPYPFAESVAEEIVDIAEEHGVEVEVETTSTTTVAKLKEEAQSLGVEGASGMKKQELIDAIKEANAESGEGDQPEGVGSTGTADEG